jgi:uncharacterized 2Fe-2S/4Fe-4S cluster protein (DUF4445 family)
MATVHFVPRNVSVPVVPGSLLIDAIRAAGITMDAPCDGAGTCGKCRARIPEGAAFREAPHGLLPDSEREAGWVLACQTTVHGDLRVETASSESDGLKILSEGQALAVEIDPWITKSFDSATTVYAGGVPIAIEPGDTTGLLYGAAIDIGTTTLVAALIDLRSGRELAVASSLNPQARQAQDVLSRIKLGSSPEGLASLQSAVIGELNRLISQLTAETGVARGHIYEAVFSGNTTMLHLAAGVNPASLGKYPYTVALEGGSHLRAGQLGLAISPHGLVYLPPVMSAYVGADITSGILATRLAERRGVALFVDIGTNGEMALAVDGRLTATSTAAGPAFEGMNIACGMRASRGAVERFSIENGDVRAVAIGDADPVGVCGSGLLDIVAELAANGGVDKNGRFCPNGSAAPWKTRFDTLDGKPIFRVAGPVYVSQKDIRQVQLAKAAVRAGIDLLLGANGLTPDRVDRVLIAGSFGFHLRTESLVRLGLLPREFAGRVEFSGNTSKSGAQAFLLNRVLRDRMRETVRQVRVLELANDPAFEKTFIQSIGF